MWNTTHEVTAFKKFGGRKYGFPGVPAHRRVLRAGMYELTRGLSTRPHLLALLFAQSIINEPQKEELDVFFL